MWLQCPWGSSDSHDWEIPRVDLDHECGNLEANTVGGDNAGGSLRDHDEDPFAKGEQKEEARERRSHRVG